MHSAWADEMLRGSPLFIFRPQQQRARDSLRLFVNTPPMLLLG